jgi:hypothetical protein
MYLLIRHELNEETEAKRGEVAEAKARNRQREAQLRKTKEVGRTFPHHGHYLTHKQKRRLKIGQRLEHTSQSATWKKKTCNLQFFYPTLTLTATWGVRRRLGDGTIFIPLLVPLPILDSHTHPSQLVLLPLLTR